jgi:hypothetical protein
MLVEGGATLRDVRVDGLRDPSEARMDVVTAGAVLVNGSVADAAIDRVGIEGAPCAAVAVVNGGRVEGSDLVTARAATEEVCTAIDVFADAGGHVELGRASLASGAAAGLLATGAGTVAALTDVSVTNLGTRSPFPAPRALSVERGAALTAARVVVDGARFIGVYAVADARATLSDLLVTGGRTPAERGRGVVVLDGATADVSRARIEGTAQLGAIAALDARLSLLGVRVTATRPADCEDCTPGGVSVAAYSGARVEAEDFVIDNSALAGIQIGPDGEVALRNGLVFGNPIGVNVSGASPPSLADLSDGVRYFDNAVNLESTRLPIPTIDVPDL